MDGRGRWRGLMLGLAGLGCLASPEGRAAAAELPRPELGADLVRRLLEPATRAEAFADFLVAYDEADPEGDGSWRTLPRDVILRAHADLSFRPCPGGPEEEPLYLLTYRTDHDLIWQYRHPPDPEAFPVRYPEAAEERRRRRAWAGERRPPEAGDPAAWRPGQPLWDGGRALVFLDAAGRVRWPFGGDNYLERGVIGDLNGDGRWERVDFTRWGVRPRHTVETLSVKTVERQPRTLLEVLYNWHPGEWDATSRWTFEVVDRDGDGIAEIELGPGPEGGPLSGPAGVAFRWDAGAGRFSGPPGGPGNHWMVLSAGGRAGEATWDRLQAMSGLGYGRSAPAAPSAPPVPLPTFPPWPEREPYRHQTLAGSADGDLFRFMWTGTPHPPDPRAPRPSDDDGSWAWATAPGDLAALPPREAALAMAEANRTPEHRRRFELITEAAPGESPPDRGEVVMRSLGGGWSSPEYTDAVRGDGEDGLWVRCYHRQGAAYPVWSAPTEWHLARIGSKARWLVQTVWWLDRIRTVSKQADEVPENPGFGADDIPVYQTLLAAPAAPGEAPRALAFPTTQGGAVLGRWRGHYDREVAASLALALWMPHFPERNQAAIAPSEARDRAVVRALLDDAQALEHWPIPDPLRLAIATAGDRVWKDCEPALGRLTKILSEPPGTFESTYRMWQSQRKESRKAWGGDTRNPLSHERYREAERALAPLEAGALTHPGIQLREALDLARRQFALADDRDRLLEWSARAEEPGAAWALKRVSPFPRAETPASLQPAELDHEPAADDPWIFGDRVKRDLAGAIALWKTLPEDRRHALLPLVYERLSPEEQRAPEWIAALVGLVRHPQLAETQAVRALRVLVPEEDPARFPDPAIDEALVAFLEGLRYRESLDFSERPLRLAACRALALRDGEARHWNLLADLHDRSLRAGDGDEPGLRSVLVSQVARHPQLAQEYWLRLRLKDAHGQWNDFFFDAFAADLRLARDDLARAATRTPEEPEGPRADWSGLPDTLKGGFHSARQVIALWDEPDAVTRAKMGVVFGLRAQRDETPGKLAGAWDRMRRDLAGAFPGLDPAGKAELRRWIGWCGETAPGGVTGEEWTGPQRAWLDALAGQLAD